MSFFQPRKSASSEISVIQNENYLPPPPPEVIEQTRKMKMKEWEESERLRNSYKDQRSIIPPPFFGKVPVGQVNPLILYKHAEASPWFTINGTSRGVIATLSITSDPFALQFGPLAVNSCGVFRVQAGHRKKAISKPPRRLRLKNRSYFQDRVLGKDGKGRLINARTVEKYAVPLETRRQQHRLKQEAREEVNDPSYVPGDPIITITNLSSSLSSDD